MSKGDGKEMTKAESIPTHQAKRLTLLVGVRDRVGHGSLVGELLQRGLRFKLAGASAFEGRGGFGASGHMHRTHLVSDDSPVAVIFVDRPEKIDAFLNEIAELLDDVLIIEEDVTIIEV